MSFYNEMEALVSEFTSGEFFSDAVITRASAKAFDKTTGKTTSTPVTLSCRAVAKEVMTKADNGALVSSTMLILSVEPKEGDVVTIGGDTHTIGATVMRISPIGQPLLYKAVAK